MRVGAKWGHCARCACRGQEAVLCASIPPARQQRKSQLLPLPGAATGSAVRAQAPQRRIKREPPESLPRPHLAGGGGEGLLHVLSLPVGAPSLPLGSRAVYITTEARTHWTLGLYSWHWVRCEAGIAQRAGEPARPTCESAIHADQTSAAPTPSERRWGGLAGAEYRAPLAYFTS